MVRAFIEGMLGEVGRQILYFYEANALVINSVVLTYGVFIYASWMNLVRIYRFLIVEMATAAHTSEELNRKKTNKKIRDTIGIPWEKAVDQAPFPFIARTGGLLPRRNTVENLKFYFSEKDLADKTLKALQGERIQRMSPSSQKIMQKELEELKKKSR